MTNEELDQLALEIWNQTPACDHEKEEIIEFARRYRAALKEKMEPVAWVKLSDEHGACAYCWNGKKHDTPAPAIPSNLDEIADKVAADLNLFISTPRITAFARRLLEELNNGR